jgi:hypothetical protein
MKPLHVGLLVLGAALAGGLAVRMTQAPPLPVASLTPANPPVVVPPAPAVVPPPVTQPKSAQPKFVTPKKPSPLAPRVVYTAPARRPETARPAVVHSPIVHPAVVHPAVIAPRKREEIAQAKPLDVPPLPADPPAAPMPEPVPAKVVVPPPAPEPPPALHQVTLKPGITIQVRLDQTLSSARAVAGNAFTGSLVEPIVVDGLVIAERGARVTGRVLGAQQAGRVSGVSMLELSLSSVTTADGQHVSIATDPWTRRAPAVELPGETVVDFRVSSAVTIAERRI